MKKGMMKPASLLLIPFCISLSTELAMASNMGAPSTKAVYTAMEPPAGWELNPFPKMVFPSQMEVYFYSALFAAGDTSTVMFLVANALGQVVWSTWSTIEGVSLPDYDLVNLNSKKQLPVGEYMFTVGIFSATGGVSFAPRWYHFTVQY
jgi:hypothetical protein